MNYQVSIEGQTIKIPPEIAENDDQVRQALAPFFPDAANALITRSTEGETTTINVVKKAGSKGAADPLGELQATAGGVNPAVALYQRLNGMAPAEMTAEAMLQLDDEVQAAISAGQEQADLVVACVQRLRGARPACASGLPVGF